MKLYYPHSRVTARQNASSVRVVQLCNKLPEELVSASSVSAFISRLNSMRVSFLPRDAMHPRYYPWACVRLSVCLCLCPCLSQAGVLLKRQNV